MSSVTLDRLVRTNPPLFEGMFEGTALEVHLDSSALLKLEDRSSYEDRAKLLFPAPSKITDAVRRIVAARQIQPERKGIVVTVSALDLD